MAPEQDALIASRNRGSDPAHTRSSIAIVSELFVPCLAASIPQLLAPLRAIARCEDVRSDVPNEELAVSVTLGMLPRHSIQAEGAV